MGQATTAIDVAASHADKNRDIEVLRAFAVLGVVAHHYTSLLPGAPVLGSLAFGVFNLAAGVDLFFAISGFVIARSFLPRLYSSSNTSKAWNESLAFWTKRVFRLWPTALLWLLMILIVTAIWDFDNASLDFKINVDASLAGVLQYANFRFAHSFASYNYGASFHYWTLSLEEQFYLIFPVVAVLSRRFGVLAAVIAMLIVVDNLRPISFYAIATRTSALGAGVLIAIWSMGPTHAELSCVVSRINRWVMFPLMIAGLVLVAWVAGFPAKTMLQYGFVAAAAAFCVVVASFNCDALSPQGVWSRVMMWVGSRSYALYVIHVPVLLVMNDVAMRQVAPQVLTQPAFLIAFAVATLAMVALLAEANFRLVETPLRKIGIRIAGRISRTRGGAAAA